MDMSTIREAIRRDTEIESIHARILHSLEDRTLYDLVRLARAAGERGRTIEIVADGGCAYWAVSQKESPAGDGTPNQGQSKLTAPIIPNSGGDCKGGDEP